MLEITFVHFSGRFGVRCPGRYGALGAVDGGGHGMRDGYGTGYVWGRYRYGCM